MIAACFGHFCFFFGLVTAAFASETLDTLVNASTSFSAAILQQLAAVQCDQTLGRTRRKDDCLCDGETAYYQALRAAAPVLVNIATGKEPRPPELDKVAAVFSVAGEKQEKAADEETAIFC